MGTKLQELTQTQERALLALADLMDVQKYTPSIEEWAAADGRSYGTVYKHREALLELGMIEHEPGRTRSVRITDAGRRAIRRARLRS